MQEQHLIARSASKHSLLAVPAMIAACGVYATARRARTSNLDDAKLTPAVE